MKIESLNFVERNNTFDLTASIEVCNDLLISNVKSYLEALKTLDKTAQELRSELLAIATSSNLSLNQMIQFLI